MGIIIGNCGMKMKLTVIYDNEARNGLKNGWGFSCLIETTEHTILFDTGWDGHVLLDNMRTLSLSPEDVDILVLSHQHWDHIGGVPTFLNANPDVDIYVPTSFSKNLKKEMSARQSYSGISESLSEVDIPIYPRMYEVKAPREICRDVYTTGELGTGIKEQSLVLDSGKGLYVLAGCAHPGLSAILDSATSFGTVAGIIGGFHDSREYDLLKDLQLVGAGHCTAHKDGFRQMYPEKFAEIFAGYSLTI